MDHWVLRRVAMMLSALEPAKAWEILQGLREDSAFDLTKNGDSLGKVRGEIAPPEANLGDVS